MNTSAADTVDACQARLHAEGLSIGDMAVRTAKGTMWMAFAQRGDERVVAKARRQATAWKEAVRLAEGPKLNDHACFNKRSLDGTSEKTVGITGQRRAFHTSSFLFQRFP